jgi:hypothetical protein
VLWLDGKIPRKLKHSSQWRTKRPGASNTHPSSTDVSVTLFCSVLLLSTTCIGTMVRMPSPNCSASASSTHLHRTPLGVSPPEAMWNETNLSATFPAASWNVTFSQHPFQTLRLTWIRHQRAVDPHFRSLNTINVLIRRCGAIAQEMPGFGETGSFALPSMCRVSMTHG